MQNSANSYMPLDLPSNMSSLTSIDSVDVDPFSEELHLAKSRPTSPQRNTQQVDSDSDSDELTKLEMELKCSVCNDFYDVPMSSKCQHTFCAGCTKFDYNNKTTALCCPICENSFTTFTQLYKNTLIEELIKEYKTNRGLITNLYALGKQAKRRVSRGEMNEPIKASDSFMSISDCNSDFSPVEEKTKLKRTLEKSINLYDSEQKRRRLYDNGNKNSTKPSKKPKLAYSVMNERKLKNLLKEEGLLTHGSKNEMIARHSYFINLYNSNVDATNPKSKGELLREVKKWERAQQSDEAKNANLIKKSLTNPEEVNFYARKYQDHYAELIQQARNSNNKKRKEI